MWTDIYSPHQDRVRLCSNNAVDGRFRVRLRFRCHFRTVCDPFGEDKFHIGNADKAGTWTDTASPGPLVHLCGSHRGW